MVSRSVSTQDSGYVKAGSIKLTAPDCPDIADLRACRVRELEEKRVNKEMAHIRQKFKGRMYSLRMVRQVLKLNDDARAEGNLDGYQRKKYLSKIVFTYILGYDVDVGHMEAVNLISSSKYSEKQIGYLALTLLMHEDSDLIRLIVNSIRKDQDSQHYFPQSFWKQC